MAALFSGYAPVLGSPIVDAGSKIVALMSIMIVLNLLWLLGVALTLALRHPARGRVINVTFAMSLIVSLALAFAPSVVNPKLANSEFRDWHTRSGTIRRGVVEIC
jgi:hypothetical protein